MKKILSIFAAALVAIAVNAQTDFSSPGYSCAASDAVLSGSATAAPSATPQSNKLCIVTADPAYLAWKDVSSSTPDNAVATWTVTATRGCYVSVTLDLSSVVIDSNKHIFEVKIKDDKGNVKGTLAELAENADAGKQKTLDGTILLPKAGVYTVELRNNRSYGKGAVLNVILTYAADAPSEIIEVSSVELNKTELALDIQEVEQLSATVSPDDATDPSVTWTSSDEAVATVSDGFVTAIAAGTATITAKAGEKSATCAVTVAAAPVPEVKLTSTYTLAAKNAHLEGKIWKKYEDSKYKLYGDGGHNAQYGNALWTIHVTNPCIISASLMDVGGGCLYELDVFKGEDSITTVIQPAASKWWSGIVEMDGTITLAEAGKYTFRLRNTLEWSSGKTSGISLIFQENLAPAEPKTLYLKISDDWKYPSKYAIYYFDDNSNTGWSDFMALAAGEEDIYTATIPAEYADDKIIFVRFNSTKESTGNWDEKWSQTINLEIPEGKDMFTITSGGTGDQCDGKWSKYGYVPVLENGYYLVGNFADVPAWGYEELTAAKKFVVNPDNAEEYQLENVTLAAEDSIKVVYVENDEIQWYAPKEANYAVDANHAGVKTVYFRPSGNGGEDWWYGCIYVPANSEDPTAIENTNAAIKTVKMIENGQMIIIKNGVKYNAQGAIVK